MSMSATGPLTPEELKALVEARHGQALKAIQKHDPLYGKLSNAGDPVKYRVKLTKDVRAYGYVTVEAVTPEDAEAMAEEIPDHLVSWDYDDDGVSEAEWVKRI